MAGLVGSFAPVGTLSMRSSSLSVTSGHSGLCHPYPGGPWPSLLLSQAGGKGAGETAPDPWAALKVPVQKAVHLNS
jgi:hypothetical protein